VRDESRWRGFASTQPRFPALLLSRLVAPGASASHDRPKSYAICAARPPKPNCESQTRKSFKMDSLNARRLAAPSERLGLGLRGSELRVRYSLA